MIVRHLNPLALALLLLATAVVYCRVPFVSTGYFMTHQVRLIPSTPSTQSTFLFLPQTLPSASTVGLALSGYHFLPSSSLSFALQLSLDTQNTRYQLILTTANSTSFSFLNYFLIEIDQSAHSWLQVFSKCMTFSNSGFSLVNLNRNITQAISSPFPNTQTDNVTLVPFIRSLNIHGVNNGLYFNLTAIVLQPQSALGTVFLYANYSFTIEACLTIVAVRQGALKAAELTAYEVQTGLRLRSDGSNSSLLAPTASNNFGISSKFGPILAGKCIVALQSLHLRGNVSDSISYDLTTTPPTSSSSSFYSVNYNYLCLASIACPSSLQYYPLLDTCQGKCTIPNCSVCSSSTSCLTCASSFFLNPLLRCSSCMSNCLTCSSASTCSQCADGLFYSGGVCQLCPLKCLRCTASTCSACSYGYLATGNSCISCQVPMPHCLSCFSSGDCALCETGWIFDGGARGCVMCSSKMANCLQCNFLNNCQKCAPTHYLKSFNLCQLCTFSIDVCCPAYVPNCSTCATNSTCSKCVQGFYLNTSGLCQTCSMFGSCAFCNPNGCLACAKGFYALNGSCISCGDSIRNCGSCSNGSVCLECLNGYQLADGKCLLCPIWPLNQLYFMDAHSNCLPCSNITPHCQTCSLRGVCLSCTSLYFFDFPSASCLPCSTIPHCLSCQTNSSCSVCLPGYTVNVTSPLTCINCSLIQFCLDCKMTYNGVTMTQQLQCSTCRPSYFPQAGVCILCGDAISNCQQCIGPFDCLLCSRGYYLTPQKTCATCGQVSPGCQTCTSTGLCKQCSPDYLLQGGYCSQCSMTLPNCLLCSTVSASAAAVCSKCAEGHYLSADGCSSCGALFPLCSTCSPAGCLTCISGYILDYSGQCVLCAVLVPHCLYCTPNFVCKGCIADHVLSPLEGSCLPCQAYLQGCASCSSSVNSTSGVINCTRCHSGYLSLPSPSNSSSLICQPCNASIPHCLTCASTLTCSSCLSSAFLNPEKKCSLCRLHLLHCLSCSSASRCEVCENGFVVGSQGLCLACNLNIFGFDPKNNQFLCLGCQNGSNTLCSGCVDGAYLVLGRDRCELCSGVIANCFRCIGSSTCITCADSFYLSPNSTVCSPCSFPNCLKCTASACLTCLSSFYLSPNKTQTPCLPCTDKFPFCLSCTSNACNKCNDGYYLNGFICESCGKVDRDCLLCDSAVNCIIRQSKAQSNSGSVGLLIVGIVAIVFAAIIVAVVAVWYCRKKRKKDEQNGSNSEDIPETHRRMNDSPSSDVQISTKANSLCHYCLKNHPQSMRVQLLCGVCQSIGNRGQNHVITQKIGNQYQFQDRVIEDDGPSKVNWDKMEEINRQIIELDNDQKDKRKRKGKRNKGGLIKAHNNPTSN